MQHEVWARLTSSFPTEALAWIVAELDGAGDRARLEPAWSPEAVRRRLDSELGVGGWSSTLSAFGSEGVICALTVVGATRSAVAVRGAVPVPLEQLADLAFSRCARQFGMAPAVEVDDPSYWVEYDPEAGVPLFEPEPLAAEGAGGPVHVPETPRAEPAQPAREASSEALAMIEKLIDRLKAEGKGKEAARLVAMHHGDTAEQARELYSRLRSLLKQESGA